VASEKVTPSKRQDKSVKAGYHRDGVWCVLFVKLKDVEKAQEVGDAKRQEGDQAHLRNHAEQRWWDHSPNPPAITAKASRPDFERFEFEVTTDFCTKADEGGRATCKKRFKEARMRAGVGKKIYIFIMRERIYYEVTNAGEVELGGTW
jgi:hypothetical protein